jgi:hypothetical protein
MSTASAAVRASRSCERHRHNRAATRLGGKGMDLSTNERKAGSFGEPNALFLDTPRQGLAVGEVG